MTIAAVAVPLMVLVSLATHFNARFAVARQNPETAASQQAALMNKLMLWVFPFGHLSAGRS